MNKRFFTLMAAVLLAGAPFANEALATPTASPYATATALSSGFKFVLSDNLATPKYVTVTKDATNGTATVDALSETDVTKAAQFEIKNYSSSTKTFELWVDGYKVVNGTTSTFYAGAGSAAVGNCTFTNIYTISVGASGTAILPAGVKANKLSETITNAELNANLSGQGFKFNFPEAVSQPDVNPFGDQMIAIKSGDVRTGLSIASGTAAGDSICFVKADKAGKDLLAKIGAGSAVKADYEAASFIVVDPASNFGITGLNVTDAAGQGFTTVKGDKLNATNAKATGKINIENAIFKVLEDDKLNAADEYTLSAGSVDVYNGSSEVLDKPVNVGAYSLTAGGLKTYVTTVTGTMSDRLALASTASNNYVTAADVLSTTGPAVYNIFFQGDATSAGQASSYYGKYLVYDPTAGTALDTLAKAPAKVDPKLAEAQWYVSKVSPKGKVTFKNKQNATTGVGAELELQLYKTATPGVFDVNDGIRLGTQGANVVRLIPAVEDGTYLTVSEAQQKLGAELVFNGTGNVNVDKIYMNYDKATSAFVPTTDESKNFTWFFGKAKEVEREITYAYLKNNGVETAKDTLKIQLYNLLDENGSGFYWESLTSTYGLTSTAASMFSYAFRKYADGTYAMIEALSNTYPTIANPMTAVEMVVNTSRGVFASQFLNTASKNFAKVTIDFKELGESLESVSRHATLVAENGGISLQENAKGVLEGVFAGDPLTFWLDTADTDADVPSFYISKGIPTDEEEEVATKAADELEVRWFMYSPNDSAYYWNANEAKYETDPNYYLPYTTDVKVIFRPAALVGVDTLATIKGNDEVLVSKKAKAGVCEAGVENFKFNIVRPIGVEEYNIVNAKGDYLYNLNGVLGFTNNVNKALAITIGEGDATANEAIEAESNVQVIGGQGVVTVQGAAGKVITVANILGQTIANQVAASDNVTIAVPAGIVVVAVDGEATKVVVK